MYRPGSAIALDADDERQQRDDDRLDEARRDEDPLAVVAIDEDARQQADDRGSGWP